MTEGHERVLGASRTLLQVLRILNIGVGLMMLVGLPASFIFAPVFHEFFSKRPPRIDADWILPTLRIWLVLGVGMVAAAHVLFSRLLAIVATVRAGDAFAPDNAVRLRTIAWSLLALQLFHPIFGIMAAVMNAAGSNIEWRFSLTDSLVGWTAVLLMFVLSRVFEEGARIRTDLETMI
jgi:hypothetical protein